MGNDITKNGTLFDSCLFSAIDGDHFDFWASGSRGLPTLVGRMDRETDMFNVTNSVMGLYGSSGRRFCGLGVRYISFIWGVGVEEE